MGYKILLEKTNLRAIKKTPEVQVKYRIFEETESAPAFLVGLDTQGFGPFIEKAVPISIGESPSYLETIERYEQKAWGLYPF